MRMRRPTRSSRPTSLRRIATALESIAAGLADLNAAADEARRLDYELSRRHMQENRRMQAELLAHLSPQPDDPIGGPDAR
jgi:hypothetical protein